jgi:ribosomal protein S12 methylthiotransferase
MGLTYRYFLDPYGCVKNQVDAETMMAVLDASGLTRAEDADSADLIIINSCGFIDPAKQESINAVLTYRRIYPDKKILLAGCLAQRYAGELAESLAEADGFFGNRDLSGAALAARAVLEGQRLIEPLSAPREPALPAEFLQNSNTVANAPHGTPLSGDRPLLSLPGSAYVKISEGCNNRCAFCAIPGIRGPLRSRAIPGVAEECQRLLERGIRELCLIGQDLGSYGRDLGDGTSLPALLEALSALEGRFWVRLLYIHPDNFPFPILDLCRRDSRFLPYFDTPFQHGSTRILRAMNRRGSAGTYLDLIARIREALPGAVIRSTFLTGFPGETEEDFRELLDFQEKADLDWAGAFSFSREEGTAAYTMTGWVGKKLAAERKRLVEEKQRSISEKRMERFKGMTTEVLVEERINLADGEDESGASGRSGEFLYLGRLPSQAPEVDGSALIFTGSELELGSLLDGRVFGRSGLDLEVRVDVPLKH